MSEQEPTIKDVLAVMTSMESRLRGEIQESQSTTMEAIHGLATHLDEQTAAIRAGMATKDFVDRRFNQLDAKIGMLTDTLEKKSVISKNEAHNIMIAS